MLLVVSSVILLLSFVVIWFYWKGRNWARWLVLLTCLLALLNLTSLPSFPVLAQTVIVGEAALGAFLLVWLNTPAVRSYFTRHRLTE